MAEEKEIDFTNEYTDLSDLSGFVDIDDLSTLEGMEEFVDLADLDSLDDLESFDSLDDTSEEAQDAQTETDEQSVASAPEEVSEEVVAEEDTTEEMPVDDATSQEPMVEEAPVEEVVSQEPEAEEAPAEEVVSEEPVAEEAPVEESTPEESEAEAAPSIEEPEGDPMAELLGDLPTAEAFDDVDESALDGMLDDILEGLENVDALDEEKDDSKATEMDQLLEEEEKKADKAKKPGLLQRLFGNIVTEEIEQQERQEMEEEKAKAIEQAELDEKKKEEAEAAKEAKKVEKEAQKEAKKAAKEAKKAEKAAAKEAKKNGEAQEAEEQFEVTGRLNKVGVGIIAILTIAFLVTEIVATNVHSSVSIKNEANGYFKMKKYSDAYTTMLGTSLKEDDPETYNKIKTVMQVQRGLNAYENYDAMNYYPEALDALLQGVKRYDANLEKGKELDVVADMDECRKQIVTLLKEEYGVSEAKAYELLDLSKEEYTDQVVEIALAKKR